MGRKGESNTEVAVQEGAQPGAHPRAALSLKGAVLRAGLQGSAEMSQAAAHGAQHIKDGRTCLDHPLPVHTQGLRGPLPTPAGNGICRCDSHAQGAAEQNPGCRWGETSAPVGGSTRGRARQPASALGRGVYFSRMEEGSRVQGQGGRQGPGGIRQEGEDARPHWPLPRGWWTEQLCGEASDVGA